jgi:hypothetical protein
VCWECQKGGGGLPPKATDSQHHSVPTPQRQPHKAAYSCAHLDAALLGGGEGGGRLGDAVVEGHLGQAGDDGLHQRLLLLRQHQLLQLRHTRPAPEPPAPACQPLHLSRHSSSGERMWMPCVCVCVCVREGEDRWLGIDRLIGGAAALDSIESSFQNTSQPTQTKPSSFTNHTTKPSSSHPPREAPSKEPADASSENVVALPAVKSYVDSCGPSSFLPPNPNHDMVVVTMMGSGCCSAVCGGCVLLWGGGFSVVIG